MPLPLEEAAAASALLRFPFLGARRLHTLHTQFGSFFAIWKTNDESLAKIISKEHLTTFLENRRNEALEREFATLEENNIQTIDFDDPAFPALLKQIPDPPALLFYRGTLETDAAAVSLVGTRSATSYGLHVAQTFGADLARAGMITVSGLALGIDGAVHKGTIDGGGRTWAFLPSGVADKDIYPTNHSSLAKKILETNGALISESPTGSEPFKWQFLLRNRLIAGISLGTVVIEAHTKSGSLITARAAREYDREIFAVPGDIWRQTSLGPHLLLKEGAHIVNSAEDILDVLGYIPQTADVVTSYTEAEETILRLLKAEPLHIDDIGKRTQTPMQTLLPTLSSLELRGIVRMIGGGEWAHAGTRKQR